MARSKTTDDAHFADAADAFKLNAHGLVGKFGQFANRTISGKRDRQDRRAVVIEFLDDGRRGVFGQAAAETCSRDRERPGRLIRGRDPV